MTARIRVEDRGGALMVDIAAVEALRVRAAREAREARRPRKGAPEVEIVSEDDTARPVPRKREPEPVTAQEIAAACGVSLERVVASWMRSEAPHSWAENLLAGVARACAGAVGRTIGERLDGASTLAAAVDIARDAMRRGYTVGPTSDRAYPAALMQFLCMCKGVAVETRHKPAIGFASAWVGVKGGRGWGTVGGCDAIHVWGQRPDGWRMRYAFVLDKPDADAVDRYIVSDFVLRFGRGEGTVGT